MRLASHKVVTSALLLFTLGIFVAPVFAQTSTWNTDIGNWSTPGNWTGGVPANTSNVVIGSTNGFASPVLDVNATINTLNLGMEASLTFGTFGLAAQSLTVNGTATLVGQTNVDEGTLTLNGASTNFNTINLTTQTITVGSHQILLGEGFLNGTGTLGNAGTIQGAGNISVTLANSGIIQATDSNNPLILSGNVNSLNVIQGLGGTIALNGGTVIGGIVQGSFSSSGGTINSTQLGTAGGITSPGSAFSLASGSALGIQGSVTNTGGLNLGANVTLNGNGTGTLVNNGSAPVFTTSGDTLIGMKINNAGGTLTAGGTGLTLNGVSLNGGVLNGQFATLNGTAFKNAQLGSTFGSFALAGGSALALQGTVSTGGPVTLGTGATLNGGGGTAALTNFLSVTGNGATLTAMTVNNIGTLTGAGAGITLNDVSLNGGILNGLFTPLNGTTIANVQLGSGATPFTLSDGSALALRGEVTVGANLTLGTGVTLNGGGQTTLFNGSNLSQIIPNLFQVTGDGATITGMNINNATPAGMSINLGVLDGAGAGLTLNAVSVSGGIVEGQLTTLNGTTLANAQVTGLSLTSGSNLALQGTVTQTGAFTNAGTLTINSGASLNNNTTETGGTVFSYVQTAGHTIVDGAIGAGGPAVQLQGGVLSGTGSLNSGLVNVNGIVQPGDAGAPGTLFTTSYEQQSGAIFNELIDASGNGYLFAGAGEITLDPGALLQINLLNGFTPTDGETFDLMFATDLSGTFVNAPSTGFQMDGFDWMIAYNSDDIVLDAVSPVSGGGGTTNSPEPSTLPLLAIGMSALFVYSCRKCVPSRRSDFAQLVS
jgi:fibronectin-binding autotransporter adhesin